MSGLFASISKELSAAATTAEREINVAAKAASDKWDEYATSPLLDTFRTGNVIQLVSRKSGKCVEIVMSPQQTLVLGALGLEGPQIYHAHWTVTNLGQNIVQLHNNGNHISLKDGTVNVVSKQSPLFDGLATSFRLHQVNTMISLESNHPSERGRYLGFLENGQVKSPIATGLREYESQFGVRLIYSPAAQPVHVQHTK